MMTFILIMVRYPEVYAKAQSEMYSVVGNKRLPDFDDKDSLPYLNALLTELYRSVDEQSLYFVILTHVAATQFPPTPSSGLVTLLLTQNGRLYECLILCRYTACCKQG